MSISRNTLAQSARGIYLFQGCEFCGCFQETQKCQCQCPVCPALQSECHFHPCLFWWVSLLGISHLARWMVSVPTYFQHQPTSHHHEIPHHSKAHNPNLADLSECFQQEQRPSQFLIKKRGPREHMSSKVFSNPSQCTHGCIRHICPAAGRNRHLSSLSFRSHSYSSHLFIFLCIQTSSHEACRG